MILYRICPETNDFSVEMERNPAFCVIHKETSVPFLKTIHQTCDSFSFQMFHDNRTTPKLDFWLQPLPGFTHVRTPNSDRDNDHLIMEALGEAKSDIEGFEGTF